MPRELLEPVRDALGDLVSRYARTHGPFRPEDVARRLGLGPAPVAHALERLEEQERVLQGEFLRAALAAARYADGARGREWCDAEVLRGLRRRSLARLRRQVEPVEQAALSRLQLDWQGIAHPRRGVDALLGAVEQIQGAPLPASALEGEALPARIDPYRYADLDLLCSAGEVVWRGVDPLRPPAGPLAPCPARPSPPRPPPPPQAAGALATRGRVPPARGGPRGRHPGRLRRRLRRAQGDGGVGPRAPRILRRRPGRHAVRLARCGRAAARAAGRSGGAADCGARGDRPGQPLRSDAALALAWCGRRGDAAAAGRRGARGAGRWRADRMARAGRAEPPDLPAGRGTRGGAAWPGAGERAGADGRFRPAARAAHLPRGRRTGAFLGAGAAARRRGIHGGTQGVPEARTGGLARPAPARAGRSPARPARPGPGELSSLRQPVRCQGLPS